MIDCEPGIPTAVAGEARSMRSTCATADADALARMLAGTREAVAAAATERGCEVGEEPIWRIEPIAVRPRARRARPGRLR